MPPDDILCGRLKLWQPAAPRVSMDTVLLAAWTRVRAGRGRFVELGSAAGAVSLMLALRFPPPFTITGVEIRPDLAELARRNLALNGLDRARFVQGDLRSPSLLPREAFDGLVVNPPYGAGKAERPSPDAARSLARQGVLGGEEACTLDDVASAAARLLKGRGRLFAVFRTSRLAPFLAAMSARALAPKRLRFVHPRPGEPSNLFLIECAKGGGEGLTVEPPLTVAGEDGEYTADLLRCYEL